MSEIKSEYKVLNEQNEYDTHLLKTSADQVVGLGRMKSTAYSVGDVVYTDNNLQVALKCATEGTTSDSELDISTNVVGDSVADGGVVWEVVKRDLSSDFEDLELNLLPVGTSIMYMADTVPEGFLDESGAEVSRTTYARLFAVIGTKYGSGDGSTTFNLPNKNNGSFAEGSTTAGTVKSAGLPAIGGSVQPKVRGIAVSDSGSNTFYSPPDSNTGTLTSLPLKNTATIYGASTTVQPKAVTVKFCIKY